MILIIGGNGTLGSYLQESLKKSNLPYHAPTRNELDISSSTSVDNYFKNSCKYKVIYHLAAETNVDLCEREPNIAYSVNFLGTKRVGENAAKSDSLLVYISTSAVFGGGIQKWRYCELDSEMPVNLYGSSKLMGEKIIKELCKYYFIVRSSWMIGGGPENDKKFLSKIIPEIKGNRDIKVVHDKVGSLTYAKDLAEFLTQVSTDQHRGIMHFSSKNYASRYDIARYITNVLNSKSKITAVDSSMFPLSAPRPLSEAIYSVANYIETKEWQDIIDDYLKNWL